MTPSSTLRLFEQQEARNPESEGIRTISNLFQTTLCMKRVADKCGKITTADLIKAVCPAILMSMKTLTRGISSQMITSYNTPLLTTFVCYLASARGPDLNRQYMERHAGTGSSLLITTRILKGGEKTDQSFIAREIHRLPATVIPIDISLFSPLTDLLIFLLQVLQSTQ